MIDTEPETADIVAIDVTGDVCPMTFVRTRLALDRLPPGGVLRVRLRGATPLDNVTRSARQLGHAVTRQPDDGGDMHEILVVKAAGGDGLPPR
ncbi:sulfurtransferase TusA family protein [Gluconacetobacter tumulisoli]|uniref:Sulfurtransferase TusA family protein n=1 Tax=Gluconacetobacter tumulisoli TaxID=1286189 RepID=A0A7W4K8B4_9PROT|nr:sulfurtransferase TusA family protein [Gluconacetobacter tumulisoli]MBB2202158.1 sulfurtransferase TusA family protein [Gluconacetobacter tumulisoli]